MTTRNFALSTGILYLIIGVLAFFPGQVSAPPIDAPQMVIEAGYGYLFGQFPVNVLHNLMYLVLGGWALSASRSLIGARSFAQRMLLFCGLLTAMGLFPLMDTGFGLIPLFGYNVGLHAVTAVMAAYFGYQRAPEGVLVEQAVPRAA
jgi:hypothetical protein